MAVNMNVIKAICDKEDIHLFMIPKSKLGASGRHLGLAMSDGETNAVFIQDKLGKWETQHIAAHEIAHILLGHLQPDCNRSKERLEEARMFAASFLALSVQREYGEAAEGGVSNDKERTYPLNQHSCPFGSCHRRLK